MLPTYLLCLEKHKAFHQYVGAIAKACNAGQYTEAEEQLASAEHLKRSRELRAAIRAFQQESRQPQSTTRFL